MVLKQLIVNRSAYFLEYQSMIDYKYPGLKEISLDIKENLSKYSYNFHKYIFSAFLHLFPRNYWRNKYINLEGAYGQIQIEL